MTETTDPVGAYAFAQLGLEPLPAIECVPWCEYGDGHVFHVHREDQICYSPAVEVDLSLHGALEWPNAAGSRPDWLAVFGVRRADQPVQINVGHNEKSEVELTIAEARQLIEALQLVLGQVGA